MSLRWPVPCQGSLTMKTSPSFILASGTLSSTWPTLIAIELTWPGVPVTAWASMRPLRVVDAGRQVARLARRRAEGGAHQGLRLLLDDGDQAVPHHLVFDAAQRMVACSLSLRGLLQNGCLGRETNGARRIERGDEARGDDGGGLVLGDDGGTLHRLPGFSVDAQVDRDGGEIRAGSDRTASACRRPTAWRAVARPPGRGRSATRPGAGASARRIQPVTSTSTPGTTRLNSAR